MVLLLSKMSEQVGLLGSKRGFTDLDGYTTTEEK
jgi:hypothetical protein